MQVVKEYAPGPWGLGENTPNTIFNESYDAICTACEQVLDVPVRKTGQPVRKANARLISAAPDLVKAVIGQAMVRGAEHTLGLVKSTWEGSDIELDAYCREQGLKNWQSNLTTSALEALTKAGVLR